MSDTFGESARRGISEDAWRLPEVGGPLAAGTGAEAPDGPGDPGGPDGPAGPGEWWSAPTPPGPPRQTLGIVVLAIALVLAGLAGLVAYHAAGSSSSDAVLAPGYTAAGCGRPAQTGSILFSFTDQGRMRDATVRVPVHYVATRRTPVVFLLHGSGGIGPGMEQDTDMDVTADAHTFIAVYPTASIPDSGGYDWNVSGDPVPGTKTAPNDVQFLVDLLSILEQRYCVSPKMVYATGFSRGARLADDLACRASTVFAAVAPSSGVRLPAPCPSLRPVSLLAIHGTADPKDPYDGNGPTFWTYSVPVAMQRWAAHDGCNGRSTSSHVAEWTTRTVYSGCLSGVGVELYTVAGATHEWQGGLNGYYNARGSAIDADAVIWAFFASHPMR